MATLGEVDVLICIEEMGTKDHVHEMRRLKASGQLKLILFKPNLEMLDIKGRYKPTGEGMDLIDLMICKVELLFLETLVRALANAIACLLMLGCRSGCENIYRSDLIVVERCSPFFSSLQSRVPLESNHLILTFCPGILM